MTPPYSPSNPTTGATTAQWPSHLADVVFDHPAAAAAATSADGLAGGLRRSAVQRRGLAAEAQREWRGGAAEQFDRELARLGIETAELESSVRALAAALRQASADAAVRQAARVAERERWCWEQALAASHR